MVGRRILSVVHREHPKVTDKHENKATETGNDKYCELIRCLNWRAVYRRRNAVANGNDCRFAFLAGQTEVCRNVDNTKKISSSDPLT